MCATTAKPFEAEPRLAGQLSARRSVEGTPDTSDGGRSLPTLARATPGRGLKCRLTGHSDRADVLTHSMLEMVRPRGRKVH